MGGMGTGGRRGRPDFHVAIAPVAGHHPVDRGAVLEKDLHSAGLTPPLGGAGWRVAARCSLPPLGVQGWHLGAPPSGRMSPWGSRSAGCPHCRACSPRRLSTSYLRVGDCRPWGRPCGCSARAWAPPAAPHSGQAPAAGFTQPGALWFPLGGLGMSPGTGCLAHRRPTHITTSCNICYSHNIIAIMATAGLVWQWA